MSSKRKKNDDSDEESDRVNWEKEYPKKRKQLTEVEMELVEMGLKTTRLEWQLKYANTELLVSKSMLSARGVIEWLEERHDREMPDSVRRDVRHDRWKWIFVNDPTFSDEVRSYFPRSTAERVAKMVDKILSNAAANTQSSDVLNGLVLFGRGYTTDQQDVLKAICATIPCRFSTQ